jgi:hypothetical protein
MARFHFYAPFIKCLSVFDYFESLALHNWDSLITYSQTRELLPNLVELSFYPNNLQPEFPWLLAFASRSSRIVKLYKPSNPQLLDASTTGTLLQNLASRCPNLWELEFYSEPDYSDDDESEDISQSGRPHVFAPLGTFHRLYRLTSTPAVIQSQALQLLAQLPNLNTLWIRADSHVIPWDPSLCEPLPVGAFPALDNCSLDFETSRDVRAFWELVPLAILTGAYISIHSISDGDECQFIPILCRASPQIKSIRLSFPVQLDLDEEDRQIQTISYDMFEHLARLPLNDAISLGSAKFGFDDAWVSVARAWPCLSSISCLHQPTHLSDLFLLSTNIPGLYRIECDLDLEHAARNTPKDWQPEGRPARFTGLRYVVIKQFELREHASSYEYDLSDLAR